MQNTRYAPTKSLGTDAPSPHEGLAENSREVEIYRMPSYSENRDLKLTNSRNLFNLGLAILFIAQWTAVVANPVDDTLVELIRSEQAVGAQAYIGEDEILVFERNYGVRSIDDKTPVDSETLFCIGSCSKPYASAAILSLVETGVLDLHSPISEVLPEFSNLIIAQSGKSSRAPNLLELLSHRGGIYSQKRGMNRRQARWIRDFRLPLSQSVSGIAKETLLAKPGIEYAYSGAGYCVLGRVVEVAVGDSFEEVFQHRIGQPLSFRRTTYFPERGDRNVAAGSFKGKVNPATPHLSNPFRLPLIGGSLYATGQESSRFARMILQRGQFGNKQVLTPDTLRSFLSLPFEGHPYGLGWSIRDENGRAIELSHSGSLASSRASMRINLDNGRFGIVFYTLANPTQSQEITKQLNRALIQMVRQ